MIKTRDMTTITTQIIHIKKTSEKNKKEFKLRLRYENYFGVINIFHQYFVPVLRNETKENSVLA